MILKTLSFHTDQTLYLCTVCITDNNGLVVCEFWNTFNTLKSETKCKYINKKNDTKEEINKPKTLILINFDSLFFFETKNCEIAKNKDKQSEIFPKNDAIKLIYITTFLAI